MCNLAYTSFFYTAPEDYDEIMFDGVGASNLPMNVFNYRGGSNADSERSFNFYVSSDTDEEEPPETFFINVTPVRTAVILTPVITVTICGCELYYT